MPPLHAPLQQLAPSAQNQPFCTHPSAPPAPLLAPLPPAAGPPPLLDLDPPAPPLAISVVLRQPAVAKRPVDTITAMQIARMYQGYTGFTSRTQKACWQWMRFDEEGAGPSTPC